MRRISSIVIAIVLGGSLAPLRADAGSNERTETALRIGRAGVTVVLPDGWHAWVPKGPAGPVVDPLTRVVVVSAPFRFAATGCHVAGYAFSRDAVALVIVEWIRPTPSARFPARPRRFTSKSLPLQPPPAIECFDGPGGAVQFADNGRRFGAYVLLGRRAPTKLADRARAVLNTLRVQRRS